MNFMYARHTVCIVRDGYYWGVIWTCKGITLCWIRILPQWGYQMQLLHYAGFLGWFNITKKISKSYVGPGWALLEHLHLHYLALLSAKFLFHLCLFFAYVTSYTTSLFRNIFTPSRPHLLKRRTATTPGTSRPTLFE